MANMSTTLTLPDGSGSITVEAHSGVQHIAQHAGPMDISDPGTVTIRIGSEMIAIIGDNLAYLRGLIDTLTAAHRVAYTRDTGRDLPPTPTSIDDKVWTARNAPADDPFAADHGTVEVIL